MNINSSYTGIKNNLNQFNTSSRNISKPSEDITKDIINSNMAKRGVEANIEVIKSKEEMTDSLLDILA